MPVRRLVIAPLLRASSTLFLELRHDDAIVGSAFSPRAKGFLLDFGNGVVPLALGTDVGSHCGVVRWAFQPYALE